MFRRSEEMRRIETNKIYGLTLNCFFLFCSKSLLISTIYNELEDLLNKIEDSKKIASNSVEAVFVTDLIKLLKENEFPLDYANSNLDNVSIFQPLAVSNGKARINDIPIEN